VITALLLLSACDRSSVPPEVPETGWHFRESFSLDPLANVTDLASHDGMLYAADLDGRIAVFDFETGERQGLMELDVFVDRSCGLLSLAFDPDFDENGLLYFGACASIETSGIYRVTVDRTDWSVSDRVTIVEGTWPDAWSPFHNIGWIEFDDEGYLFGLFGEKNRGRFAKQLDTVLGKAVRILPSKAPGEGGYTAHPDNPFVGTDGLDAIYATGLRSPWTGAFDAAGNLWVGDVGAGLYEEINVVTRGGNYGWPDVEGPCDGPCDGTIGPIASWGHNSVHPYFVDDVDIEVTTFRTSWVAAGPRDPSAYDGRLAGRVLFGDLCMGFTRSAAVDESGQLVVDEPLGHLTPGAFVDGPNGHLYASTLDGCTGATLGDVSILHELVWLE
jgi:hypothetical protein